MCGVCVFVPCLELDFSTAFCPPSFEGSNKSKKSKQHGAVSEEEVTATGPFEILVDILLTFLSRPSAAFRAVATNVFGEFSPPCV